MKPVYTVILAGGKGERLWPLSRKERPKQLIPLGATHETLLTWTLNRTAALTIPHYTWVVTNHEQENLVKSTIKNYIVDNVIAEPASKNTAPAMLLAALDIYDKDPHATVCFLPADHFIDNTQQFIDLLSNCIDAAEEQERLVLMGLKPTFPSSAYGYIETEHSTVSVLPVKKFHEKPSKTVAQYYLECIDMFWNIGIVVSSVKHLIAEFEHYMPTLCEAMQKYRTGSGSYDSLQSISFDYAVLEKSSTAVLVPASFGWSDVGNLVTFVNTVHHSSSNTIAIESEGSLVYAPKKLVALMGLDNLCVIDTDDVLLIMDKNKTEQVKEFIHLLKEKDLEQFM